MAVGQELQAGVGCSACPARRVVEEQGQAGCRRMRAEGAGGRYCESSSQWLTVGLESCY